MSDLFKESLGRKFRDMRCFLCDFLSANMKPLWVLASECVYSLSCEWLHCLFFGALKQEGSAQSHDLPVWVWVDIGRGRTGKPGLASLLRHAHLVLLHYVGTRQFSPNCYVHPPSDTALGLLPI